MSKKKTNKDGIVFSTDPDFSFAEEPEVSQTLPFQEQQLTIRLDTKHRAGKAVTLVQGFVGKETDLQALGKKIKNHCGSGGSVKEGEIIVQGDHREKIKQWLHKSGYKLAKLV